MMQAAPPRFMFGKPDEDALSEEPDKRPKRRRVRRTGQVGEPVFDVTRWRLPARWRNDKRVGDAVMAKMTRGCVLPGRFGL